MFKAIGKWRSSVFISLFLTIVLISAGHALADDVAEKGRTIVEKNEAAIVTVKIVLEQRMVYEGTERNKSEEKLEAVGTVIDPSGLTVLSLAASDPSSAFKHMMDMEGMSIESEITDLKIRTGDGTEHKSKVVLRDKDLDLMFVRPEEPAEKPFATVDLKTATTPKILDEIVMVHRLGKVAGWTESAQAGRIHAIITKPRVLYIPGEDVELGAPVFGLNGNVIGLVTLKTSKTKASFSMSQGMGSMGMLPVILPAGDILEVAGQIEAPAK
ncbi:serine protease [Candidatus Hydrogenedentota bacterium]